MTFHSRRAFLLISLLWILVAGVLSACGSSSSGSSSDTGSVQMASMKDMPMEVQQAPTTVQEAYQFAVANPEVLKQLPCYCGCGSMGHDSNYACYVQSVEADGTVQFDPHALGCSICVDIAQDALRMTKEGKAVPEIRAYVDQTYAQFGPSNIP